VKGGFWRWVPNRGRGPTDEAPRLSTPAGCGLKGNRLSEVFGPGLPGGGEPGS
jgi:hypothetical protein